MLTCHSQGKPPEGGYIPGTVTPNDAGTGYAYQARGQCGYDPAHDPSLIDQNALARQTIDAMRRAGDKCARERWNWNHFSNDQRTSPAQLLQVKAELEECERRH